MAHKGSIFLAGRWMQGTDDTLEVPAETVVALFTLQYCQNHCIRVVLVTSRVDPKTCKFPVCVDSLCFDVEVMSEEQCPEVLCHCELPAMIPQEEEEKEKGGQDLDTIAMRSEKVNCKGGLEETWEEKEQETEIEQQKQESSKKSQEWEEETRADSDKDTEASRENQTANGKRTDLSKGDSGRENSSDKWKMGPWCCAGLCSSLRLAVKLMTETKTLERKKNNRRNTASNTGGKRNTRKNPGSRNHNTGNTNDGPASNTGSKPGSPESNTVIDTSNTRNTAGNKSNTPGNMSIAENTSSNTRKRGNTAGNTSIAENSSSNTKKRVNTAGNTTIADNTSRNTRKRSNTAGNTLNEASKISNTSNNTNKIINSDRNTVEVDNRSSNTSSTLENSPCNTTDGKTNTPCNTGSKIDTSSTTDRINNTSSNIISTENQSRNTSDTTDNKTNSTSNTNGKTNTTCNTEKSNTATITVNTDNENCNTHNTTDRNINTSNTNRKTDTTSNTDKHANTPHHAATLLGFRGGCLQACAEVSVWTKFCEVEAPAALLSWALAPYGIGDEVEYPKELLRYECHLRRPPILHNALKRAQQQIKETMIDAAERDELLCRPLSELPPLSHQFAEGPDMTLADVMLFACFHVLLVSLTSSTVECEAITPLVTAWHGIMAQNGYVDMALSILEDVKEPFCGTPKSGTPRVIVPSVPDVSIYKSDPERSRTTRGAFTRQGDVEEVLRVVEGAGMEPEYMPWPPDSPSSTSNASSLSSTASTFSPYFTSSPVSSSVVMLTASPALVTSTLLTSCTATSSSSSSCTPVSSVTSSSASATLPSYSSTASASSFTSVTPIPSSVTSSSASTTSPSHSSTASSSSLTSSLTSSSPSISSTSTSTSSSYSTSASSYSSSSSTSISSPAFSSSNSSSVSTSSPSHSSTSVSSSTSSPSCTTSITSSVTSSTSVPSPGSSISSITSSSSSKTPPLQTLLSSLSLEGHIPESRLARKEQQVENICSAVLALALPGDVIVDFCSGGGHVGIPLAQSLPGCRVVLVENKVPSLERARERVRQLRLSNVWFVQSNLDYFRGGFDIGVSLHACGVATDLVLGKCVAQRAAFVVAPCCYGSIRPNHVVSYPRSKVYRSLTLTPDQYLILGHAADQTHGRDNPKTEQGQKCMRLVDGDRLARAREEGYMSDLALMHPPSCSPKNHLLMGKLAP